MSEKAAQSQEAQNFIQTLVVQPAKIQSADVQKYVNAVNQAKWGFYSQWFELVDNLSSDPFLQDQIDKLVGIVTNADLQFQIDGKAVDVINDLIETPEFEELLTEIVYSKVYGKSVVNTSFAPKFDVFSFPRKHIYVKNIGRKLSDREKLITTMPGGLTGYDYTKDEFILEFGKDSDLGILFRVAQYVIYKRGNFGDWAQYAEIFGMPFVLGKYNSTDTNARDQLFESLGKIGGNPRAAVPKETEIEVVWNSGSGSTDLYKTLKDACDEQIMIGVLGETMTTVSGSSRSQSETHLDTLDEKGKTLCRFVQRQLNSKFVPLLVKRGYAVAGGKFVFPAAKEDLTVDNLTALSKLIRIPAKWIHDKYAIPMPEGDEEVAGEQAKPVQEPTPVEPTPPEPPVNNPQKPSKKQLKLSDMNLSDLARELPSYSHPGFFERIINFFANARTEGSRAMNLSDKLTNNTEKVASTGIDIDGLIEKAIREVYGDRFTENADKSLVNKSLFESNFKPLEIAVKRQLNDVDDSEFINQFRTNTAVFSAFKAHQHTQKIVDLLVDENGKIKPFYKFKKEALQISKKWKESWLQTEYQMAVRQARLAANLKKWEKNLDVYPNLEYIETTASEPDQLHLKYARPVATVLPFHHPWWKTHMPPSRWGCQCSVRPTRKPVTAVPGGDYNAPGFENSVLDTASFVDVTETAYYKNTEEQLRDAVEKEAERLAKELLKEQRDETLKKVIKLKGKQVTNKETRAKIEFTVKGLKEAINNPFPNYTAKLEYLKQIDKALKKAEYIGNVDNTKTGSKPHILKYHYYKALIDGKDAVLVVSEDKWGKQFFYSITEKRKTTE